MLGFALSHLEPPLQSGLGQHGGSPLTRLQPWIIEVGFGAADRVSLWFCTVMTLISVLSLIIGLRFLFFWHDFLGRASFGCAERRMLSLLVEKEFSFAIFTVLMV